MECAATVVACPMLYNQINEVFLRMYRRIGRPVLLEEVFFVGFITGYAIKKLIKLALVIAGLFIAAIAYLQYQRIINVD